jgi:DNA repair exonuclease SbcCD ATPase subunit
MFDHGRANNPSRFGKEEGTSKSTQNFKGDERLIPQVIIISHDRELEDVADIIYEVTRSEGSQKSSK